MPSLASLHCGSESTLVIGTEHKGSLLPGLINERDKRVTKVLQLVHKEEEPANREAEKASAIAELFDRARRGDIPRSRELHTWEPLLLNERHCQAIMMRIMGMRQTDIAKALNYTDTTVSVILNHPDATFILDQLQGFSGVGVTDIDARLKRLTPKALDAIEAVFDSEIEDDPKAVNARVQRARLGFALLEHNGHGKKREIEHTHRVAIDHGAASLLSRALQESRQIENAEYTVLGKNSGGGVPALPSGTEAPPLSGSQSSSQDN
jgi:transcriptional regulator